MKRLLVICLCFLMLPVMALANTTSERKEAMWARIDSLLIEAGFVPNSYYHQTIIGDPSNCWSFSIVLNEHPKDENGLYVFTLTPDFVLSIDQVPEKIDPSLQLTGVLNRASGPESYAVLPDIVAQWKDKLDLLSPSFSSRVVTLDIRHPEEGAISYEDAVAAATAVLLGQPGWTEETLTHFAMIISAYMVPEDIGRPVWLFTYRKDIYSLFSIDDMDEYDAALAQLYSYTINGEPEPQQFSVLIDAMDGSLVEPPRYDYVPSEFHWTDFITRPEKLLSK